MEALLLALERSGAAEALKASFYVYPVVNAVHIAAVGALFASVVLIDLRVLGALASVEPRAFIALMRRVAFLGFGLAVLTGLALFSVRASEYAAMPVFLAKLGLILAAGLNFLLFLRLAGDGAPPVPAAACASAVASILLWAAVLLAGRFVGFF